VLNVCIFEPSMIKVRDGHLFILHGNYSVGTASVLMYHNTLGIKYYAQLHIQLTSTEILKMTAFRDIVPCTLSEVC
jgi:hypothetical protein